MTLSFQSHIPKADESRIFQYKKFKPQLECCICDKSIYSKRFVGILDDKIDMLNIYINQILEIEKIIWVFFPGLG
jgi:hypothetical protein